MAQATQTPKAQAEHTITLKDILAYLNPPNQDYDRLTSRAEQAFDAYQARGPRYATEAAVAAYFFLFGRGYLYWQQNYLYNTIHEYFYGAYARATAVSPAITRNQALNEFLLSFSRMMIHYSRCENSVISNNPSAWEYHSARALFFADKVITLIEHQAHELSAAFQADTPDIFQTTLYQYVQTNITLYQGINLCARVYLGEPVAVEQIDVFLAKKATLPSAELASELNAHLTAAKRYLILKQREPGDIIIKHADVTLRAVCSVEELDYIVRVFDKFDDAGYGPEKMQSELQHYARLPVSAVSMTPMQDIFETAVGVENLKELEVDLTSNADDAPESVGSAALAFTLNDGNTIKHYVADQFVVKISRLGTVSIEVVFGVDDIPLAHLRQIETLVAPHMGEIGITWQALQTTSQGASTEQTNFIEQYLAVQDEQQTLRSIPGVEQAYDIWTKKLQEYAQFLATDIDEPTNLITFREAQDEAREENATAPSKDTSAESSIGQKKIKAWEAYYQAMNVQIVALRQAITQSAHPAAQALLEKLALPDVQLAPANGRFGYFKDLFRLIVDGLDDYLNHLRDRHGTPDTCIVYDPNIGWQTIVSCTHLAISDGLQEIEDIAQIAKREDFKGLLVQSREARSTIDDWYYTQEPEYQNRAVIRSHITDFMVLSENRAFLFFYDDPQYIVDQYITSARIVGNLRAIVIAFNLRIKAELDRLNNDQEHFAEILKRGKARELAAYYDQLNEDRQRIETLRLRAGQVLELLRSFSLSKYQDHSALLTALIHDSNVLTVRDALKENVVELDHFQEYVSNQTQKRITANTASQQGLIAALLAIVSVVGAIAGIEPFANLIIRIAQSDGATLNLVQVDQAIIIGLVVVFISGILIWRVRRPR
jgi:hypothetical protein